MRGAVSTTVARRPQRRCVWACGARCSGWQEQCEAWPAGHRPESDATRSSGGGSTSAPSRWWHGSGGSPAARLQPPRRGRVLSRWALAVVAASMGEALTGGAASSDWASPLGAASSSVTPHDLAKLQNDHLVLLLVVHDLHLQVAFSISCLSFPS
ncbi:unnamed protein product [Urochloa humidicola]